MLVIFRVSFLGLNPGRLSRCDSKMFVGCKGARWYCLKTKIKEREKVYSWGNKLRSGTVCFKGNEFSLQPKLKDWVCIQNMGLSDISYINIYACHGKLLFVKGVQSVTAPDVLKANTTQDLMTVFFVINQESSN